MIKSCHVVDIISHCERIYISVLSKKIFSVWVTYHPPDELAHWHSMPVVSLVLVEGREVSIKQCVSGICVRITMLLLLYVEPSRENFVTLFLVVCSGAWPIFICEYTEMCTVFCSSTWNWLLFTLLVTRIHWKDFITIKLMHALQYKS